MFLLRVYSINLYSLVNKATNSTGGRVDRIDVIAIFSEMVVCGNISTDLLVRGNISINIFNPYSAAQINISASQVLSKHLLGLFLDAFLEDRVLKYKVPLVHLLI